MNPSRRWKSMPRRFKPMYFVAACLVSIYILLNLWSVEKINYEIKHLPEIRPDVENDMGEEKAFIHDETKSTANGHGQAERIFKVSSGRSLPESRLHRLVDLIDRMEHSATSDDITDDIYFYTEKKREESTGNYKFPTHLRKRYTEVENNRVELKENDVNIKSNKYFEQEMLHRENDDGILWRARARGSDDQKANILSVVNGVGFLEQEDNSVENVVNELNNNKQRYLDAEVTPFQKVSDISKTTSNKDLAGFGDAVNSEHDSEKGNNNMFPAGFKYNITTALNPSLDKRKKTFEEPFMMILEHDKKTLTSEVDLAKVTHPGRVTFPPYVDVALRNGPGEWGRPFKFGKSELTPAKKRQRLSDYDIHFFDLWVSRKISVHRKLYDMRSKTCQQTTYNFRYPTISIIMVFFNEAWSTLLRSVHSILDRSEKGVITEIILLDDGSSLGHLKEPLERYLRSLKVVRLIRASQRLGLIKARNLAFMYALGEIVIFLDSHIECFKGWLEPLIQPIVKDYKTVTWPTIETISKEDFGIRPVIGLYVGGLNFNGVSFTWIKRHDDGSLYYDSPIMPGGLYAISRKWFRHLGAYDPNLRIWGGENVEISLKIWMCGGAIRLSVCSHVGHVFRDKSPLTKENSVAASFVNSVRIAEVWMDEYKHFFYERIGYDLPVYGNISDRKSLRNQLKCHNFQWYINNIYKELKETLDVNGRFAGTIRNTKLNRCFLDINFSLLPCNQRNPSQIWMFRTTGHLCSSYNQVIGLKRDQYAKESLTLLKFDPPNYSPNYLQWEYDQNKRLVRRGKKECLDAGPNFQIFLAPCNNNASQIWELQTRKHFRQSLHKIVRNVK